MLAIKPSCGGNTEIMTITKKFQKQPKNISKTGHIQIVYGFKNGFTHNAAKLKPVDLFPIPS